jgi:hypothetical protein
VKTISLKKVAVLAVASLGFGLMSTIPANAGANVVGLTTSINLTTATSTPTVNSSVGVNFGGVFLASASTADTAPYTGVLTAYPAGGYVSVLASVDTVGGGSAATTWATTTAISGATLTGTTTKAATVTSSTSVGGGSFSFTPTVAGTYTLTVWNDVDAQSDIDITEVRQTVDIVVTAVTAFSGNLSTSFVNASGTFSGTADDEIRGTSTATTQTASIVVTLNNSGGTAYTGGGTLDVQVISGPGLVLAQSSGSGAAAASARASTLAMAAGSSIARISVTADGTTGTSQIRIRLLDSTTGASLGTIATESVYFYGTVASLAVTQVLKYAKASSTAIGCSNATTCSSATFATTPFNTIVAKDADGNLVPGLTISAVSSDATVIASSVITGSTTKQSTAADAATCVSTATDCYGLGYYTASVAGATTATSGKTATLTYRTLLSGTTYISATPVTVTIGGAVATETVAFDKTTYGSADAMIVTRTAKDASGNAPYDGQTAGEVTFNKPVSGTVGVSYYKSGVKASATSSAASALFAPVSGGALVGTMISGVDGVTPIKATTNVTDANAGLVTQIDALNAKIVALNALIAKIMKKLGVK